MTHLVLKAVARAIAQIPNLNGHVLLGSFYPHCDAGIDLSLALEVAQESVVIKVSKDSFLIAKS